ncbi:MAG: MarR family transcriptional regulator [Microbacterium sp.]
MNDAGELRRQLLDLRIELGILNDRVATACGLRPRDLDILDVIEREGPCTPTHLCARTSIHAATMTGILARLKDGGWIERIASPSDGRSADIASTTRTAELRAMYRSADQQIADLAGGFDPAQRMAISRFLSEAGRIAHDAAEGIVPGAVPT